MLSMILQAAALLPSVLLVCLFITIILKNEDIKKTVLSNWKTVLLSCLVLGIGLSALLARHFSLEDTIYTYDYAGQWIRTLELREMFFNDPLNIFKTVYYSINYSEYSYLPALLLLPSMLLVEGSYVQFCLAVLWFFLIPFYVSFAVIMLSFDKRFGYYLLCIGLFFVPLYMIIFFNEVGSVGFFYVLYIAYTLYVKDPDKLDKYDFLGTNTSAIMLLFTRRYYLYFVFAMYVLFLLRVILIMSKYKRFDLKLAVKTVSTGIYALMIIVILFMPYVRSVIGNNFREAYAAFDHNGKFLELIGFYGPICFILSALGVYSFIKNRKGWLAYFLVASVALICIMFWRIQFFEAHHYSLLTVQLLILTAGGISLLNNKNRILATAAVAILGVQTINSFVSFTDTKLLASPRIIPFVYTEKDTVTKIVDMIRETVAEDKKIWFAFGDSHFNSDIIRNRYLPDLNHRFLSKEYSYDIRDGFPILDEFDYVMIAEPGLYISKDYQHLYDVVKDAIVNDTPVSKHFKIVNYAFMSSSYLEIYERTSDLDEDAKEYLYDQMIGFYPDKTEYFSYLLE